MKNAKRAISLVLCLVMAFAVAACGQSSTTTTPSAATTAPAADTSSTESANPNARVLKWSANSPEGYPDYESAMRIKAYVEEKTNGEIILEVYPDNILGDWTVVFDEIMNGGIDFTATSVPDYYDPRIAACTLPYLTATYDEVAAVFRKGGYYDQILEECYADLNVKYFGVYADGYCGIGVKGELQNAAENDAKYKDLYEQEEGYTMVRFTDEEKKAFADDCREKVWPQLNELYGEEFLTELLADIQANT